MKPDTFERTRV